MNLEQARLRWEKDPQLINLQRALDASLVRWAARRQELQVTITALMAQNRDIKRMLRKIAVNERQIMKMRAMLAAEPADVHMWRARVEKRRNCVNGRLRKILFLQATQVADRQIKAEPCNATAPSP